ncbi:MAG: hypothetical protein LBM77_13990 [Spirochaetaceae bacterium]|nr:hypothetical protein [Spirochaetaceae bacterium]
MTRDELLAATKMPDGGEFTKVLHELEISGFIRSYYAFGARSKGTIYQLIDFSASFIYNSWQGKITMNIIGQIISIQAHIVHGLVMPSN